MWFLHKYFPCNKVKIRSISKGVHDTGETDINVEVLSLGTCFSLKVPGVHYGTDERTSIFRHIEMNTLIAYRRRVLRMMPARLKLQRWPRWTFENTVRWSRLIHLGCISKKTATQNHAIFITRQTSEEENRTSKSAHEICLNCMMYRQWQRGFNLVHPKTHCRYVEAQRCF